jgi:hypothetical protein
MPHVLVGRTPNTEIISAKLAAYAQIMINPSGTFGGTANGSLAADKAMSALYLMSRQNRRTPKSKRDGGNALAEPALSQVVRAMHRMTATLEGQTCALNQ